MQQEKETKQRLMECARAEFMEKGFLKASLRTICKEAGVTTGALYFFFKDKDALFCSLVGDILGTIEQTLAAHFAMEQEELKDPSHEVLPASDKEEDFTQDIEASLAVIELLYAHRTEALLLLTKAQGSSLEHVVDEMIGVTHHHYRALADLTTNRLGLPRLEDSFIHWVSHMQIDTFVYMITHIEEKEEAKRYIRQATHYMVNGWYGMFRSLIEQK